MGLHAKMKFYRVKYGEKIRGNRVVLKNEGKKGAGNNS